MLSSLSRGPALSIQCTPVVTELTNKELVRSWLPFSPDNHCTDRAVLHEGHTQHILYSNLDSTNSEKRVLSSVERSPGKEDVAQKPRSCRVTERASPPSPAATTGHHQDTAWQPKNPNPARDCTEGKKIPTLVFASGGFKSKLSHAVTDVETSQGNLWACQKSLLKWKDTSTELLSWDVSRPFLLQAQDREN